MTGGTALREQRVEGMFADGQHISRSVRVGLIVAGVVVAAVALGSFEWVHGRTLGSELNRAPVPGDWKVAGNIAGNHAVGTPSGGPWVARLYTSVRSPAMAAEEGQEALRRFGCWQIESEPGGSGYTATCGNADATLYVAGHRVVENSGRAVATATPPRGGSAIELYMDQPAA